MTLWQIERTETVRVRRTYKVEAHDEQEALAAFRNGEGECVDEQVGETLDWASDEQVTSADGWTREGYYRYGLNAA